MDAQTIAVVIAGFLAPFLVQFLKSRTGIEEAVALWFAVGFCLALALVAQLIGGGVPDPEQGLVNGGVTISIALVLYRQFFKPYLETQADAGD